jgi:hypothetical protein
MCVRWFVSQVSFPLFSVLGSRLPPRLPWSTISSPCSTHSPCLRRPWPLCPGLVRETVQGRIRCHGSLSGIIEIGRGHYYFAKGSTLFRNTAPATGPLLPQDQPTEEIRRAVFEVCRVAGRRHLHAWWPEAFADNGIPVGCTQLAVQDILGAGRVPFSCVSTLGEQVRRPSLGFRPRVP